MSALHLNCDTAIFVVDCCQFDPSWMYGLKTELMACADLVAYLARGEFSAENGAYGLCRLGWRYNI